jgi:hypothetical protein
MTNDHGFHELPSGLNTNAVFSRRTTDRFISNKNFKVYLLLIDRQEFDDRSTIKRDRTVTSTSGVNVA